MPVDAPHTLLLALAGPVDPEVASKVSLLVSSLREERTWTAQPPEFVYEVPANVSPQPGEEPSLTCGVLLVLDPPPAICESRASERERGQFADTEHLVVRMEAFSLAEGLELEAEYNRERIGTIAGGHADKGLRLGLLDEWRNVLEAGSRV
jgi:hypothetical protein